MQTERIAAKTGDDGYTDIIGGKRLPKDHPIIECLGTIDELNAFLGDAKAASKNTAAAEVINTIQKDLYTIMGAIAGSSGASGSNRTSGSLGAEGLDVDRLDALIGELESKLPPLNAFTVPGANPVSAKLHIARAVCRRAERRLSSLGGETAAIIPYINRLSDLLFLLAESAQ